MAVAPSLHFQILDAYEATVRGLDLDSGSGAPQVYRRLTVSPLFLMNVTFPCVVISPLGVESALGGTNATTDYSYPVVVAILDRASEDPVGMPDFLAWRKAIRDAFHMVPLLDADGDPVDGVKQSELQQSNVVELAELEGGMLFSMPLSFNVITRESRG